MKIVKIDDVIAFHNKIIERTGGSKEIRDIGLIESALNRAHATYDSKDLYEDFLDKVSVIAVSLIKNHGFIDGNKRIGIATMLLLLKLNNFSIVYQQEELIELGLKIASGQIKEQAVKTWIEEHKENKA
ncbi:MAG: type II toxin-antitoxin system death-on-curing family toxin [Clostridia bacterium]|jgi:death-on-curing protein|nr:type II toxin-antitoxin system death-on-curing family toxin [Clostridia bacterium]